MGGQPLHPPLTDIPVAAYILGAVFDVIAVLGRRNAWTEDYVQRPLWASTPTKDRALPDALYVDSLIGPDTVNTMPEPTLAAFEDPGTLARSINAGLDDAAEVLARLERLGVDMDDVGWALEMQGVAAFRDSSAHVLGALGAKAQELAA